MDEGLHYLASALLGLPLEDSAELYEEPRPEADVLTDVAEQVIKPFKVLSFESSDPSMLLIGSFEGEHQALHLEPEKSLEANWLRERLDGPFNQVQQVLQQRLVEQQIDFFLERRPGSLKGHPIIQANHL